MIGNLFTKTNISFIFIISKEYVRFVNVKIILKKFDLFESI